MKTWFAILAIVTFVTPLLPADHPNILWLTILPAASTLVRLPTA